MESYRQSVIELHLAGKTQKEICMQLGPLAVNKMFVYCTIARYISTGSIEPPPQAIVEKLMVKSRIAENQLNQLKTRMKVKHTHRTRSSAIDQKTTSLIKAQKGWRGTSDDCSTNYTNDHEESNDGSTSANRKTPGDYFDNERLDDSGSNVDDNQQAVTIDFLDDDTDLLLGECKIEAGLLDPLCVTSDNAATAIAMDRPPQQTRSMPPLFQPQQQSTTSAVDPERNELLREQNSILRTMHDRAEAHRREISAHCRRVAEHNRVMEAHTRGIEEHNRGIEAHNRGIEVHNRIMRDLKRQKLAFLMGQPNGQK